MGWTEGAFCMGYSPRRTSIDYCGYLLNLKEKLEEILESINEDDACGVDPSFSCMEAYDNLQQWLDAVKTDMGV